jgi:zinc and cadmium transporter
MNYSIYILLFFSVIISGLSVVLFKINNKSLKLLLAFSGAYLFAITVLHLIPEIYSRQNNTIGIYILAGFVLQIFLEFFSEGIEHGHIHVHEHAERVFPYTMMIGLSVHSFIEGMPLSGNLNAATDSYQNPLLIGIILHNIPIAIALMSMLMQSHIKKQTAVALLIVFAGITPLGTFTAHVINGGLIENVSQYFDRIMAVVIGIFLHISTTILFESSQNHRFNFIKFGTIIAGVAMALIGVL